jgi:hypothetical protein
MTETAKLIALVRSLGGDVSAVDSRLDAAVAKLLADRAVARLVVNRPLGGAAEPGSPFHAVLEVVAAADASVRLAGEIAAVFEVPCRCEIYTVREQVQRNYERTWGTCEASPGVKLIATVSRKPGLTLAAFKSHWSGVHADIALANPVRMWRYVQNVVIARSDGASPDVDGIVEMHYRDPEALKTRMQVAPVETMRGIEDAQAFMNLANAESIISVETILKDEPQ